MKNKLLFFSLLLCAGAGAQVRVTNGSLTLYGGTALKTDKLVLIPSGRFLVTDNQISQSTNAVSLNGTVTGINQVINLGTPMAFTGTVRMYFDPADLNGNAIDDLKLSYKTAGVWHYASGSVVNTSEYYLQETVTNKTFEALTASTYYVTLPVSMVSFSASRQGGNVVLLQWKTATEVNNHYFSVERSGDGQHQLQVRSRFHIAPE